VAEDSCCPERRTLLLVHFRLAGIELVQTQSWTATMQELA
jgi:hypothetical protein